MERDSIAVLIEEFARIKTRDSVHLTQYGDLAHPDVFDRQWPLRPADVDRLGPSDSSDSGSDTVAVSFEDAFEAYDTDDARLWLGLGMALPYALLVLMPGWRSRLPRPGAWMLRLKQALAFPMFLTVVWLVCVLGQQQGVDGAAKALIALVVLAFAIWVGSGPGRASPHGDRGQGVRRAVGGRLASTTAVQASNRPSTSARL